MTWQPVFHAGWHSCVQAFAVFLRLTRWPVCLAGWHPCVQAFAVFLRLSLRPVFLAGWHSCVQAFAVFLRRSRRSVFHARLHLFVVAFVLFLRLTRRPVCQAGYIALIWSSLAYLCSIDSAASLSRRRCRHTCLCSSVRAALSLTRRFANLDSLCSAVSAAMRLRSGARKHYVEHANIIVMRPVEHNALCTRGAAGDGRTIYTYIHINTIRACTTRLCGARSGSPQ